MAGGGSCGQCLELSGKKRGWGEGAWWWGGKGVGVSVGGVVGLAWARIVGRRQEGVVVGGESVGVGRTSGLGQCGGGEERSWGAGGGGWAKWGGGGL